MLYRYQEEGVQYILTQPQAAYLADEPGLGKTVQALEAVRRARGYPCLVVCPAVVLGVWRKEIARWLPGCSVSVVNGKSIDWNTDFVLVTYGRLKHIPEEKTWATVIFDESHYLKNSQATRTKLAFRLAKKARKKILLSGTPVLNRPIELMSQLMVMGSFWRDFKNPREYIWRYCNPTRRRFGRHEFLDVNGCNRKTVGELKRYFLRRTVEEVMSELPPVIRQDLPVSLSREAMSLYLSDVDYNSPGWLSVLFERLGRAKAVDCKDLVTEIYEEDESPIVLWVRHRETMRICVEQLKDYNPLVLSADLSYEEREGVVNAFQSGGSPVLIASILAGGVGVTLTRSHRCVFLELDWVPANLIQCEGRLRRITQTRPVLSKYVLAANTIDGIILKKLREKMENLNALHQNVMGEVEKEVLQIRERQKEVLHG